MLSKILRRALNRRDLFKGGALAAAFQSFLPQSRAAGLSIGPDLYESIGVTPIINCKGTFTIVSGSQSLPEVKAAMDQASRHYVHLDELMEGVGKRLAELTKADWGMVSAGCAAALSHATAACIAGADPEKLQRLPNSHGMRNEVIAPAYSRNVYDHAVRGAGGKFVTVRTREEYVNAFNKNTAMVMVLAGPGDDGPLGLRNIAPIAKNNGVPVLVDAAAERLTIPNVHLNRGATLVAYSGGKCLRGPQTAGLLLGRKDLVQAAWIHSAPHHAFGRPMKCGKEEIMGMLAAVEAWVKRDHEAEWHTWEKWIGTISDAASTVDGVTTEVLLPNGLSNNAPRLAIRWDGAKAGLTGQEVEKLLYEGSPRIVVGGSSGSRRGGAENSSITIMPYMMMPGDDKLAADRIKEVFATAPRAPIQPPPAPGINVSGQWDVQIDYVVGSARHSFFFEQQGAGVNGSHMGEHLQGDVRGSVAGNEVLVRSSHAYEGTRIGYEFLGKLEGEEIKGSVDVGEYGKAAFVARRHRYGQPGGPVRPVKNV
jgi:L-seryl-tRNA(Ser) seleniumtransferase